MISLEEYIREHVNYERRTVCEYVPTLERRYLEGTREDLNEYFDEVDEFFKKDERLNGYTPMYEMDYDWEGNYGDETYYAVMRVYYMREETDSEMANRINREESNALANYDRAVERDRWEKESNAQKEREERELYEKLKRKYG